MEVRHTLGNSVMIKLDPENDSITTASGVKLYVDTSFEKEKHLVVTGIVQAFPKQLLVKKLPWQTTNELQHGDRVVVYYMSVLNALAKERRKYLKKDGDTYVFIDYQNIYAVIRDGNIIPINGYILAEPMDNPWAEKEKEKLEKSNIKLISFTTKTNTDVVFAKIAYVGAPVEKYENELLSDAYVDVKPGDQVVLKKIRDIPVEYEYHAKIDGGRKLYRIQRHDILAVL